MTANIPLLATQLATYGPLLRGAPDGKANYEFRQFTRKEPQDMGTGAGASGASGPWGRGRAELPPTPKGDQAKLSEIFSGCNRQTSELDIIYFYIITLSRRDME